MRHKYVLGCIAADAARTPQVTARFFTEPAWQRAKGLYRAHRFRGHRFRVCAAAFAINIADASSARALAGGG
jgi:hypothetical protein